MFNQSILNKNSVFSFQSLLTQLPDNFSDFLVCSVTLKLPTPNPCDLAHTQAIETFSKPRLLFFQYCFSLNQNITRVVTLGGSKNAEL